MIRISNRFVVIFKSYLIFVILFKLLGNQLVTGLSITIPKQKFYLQFTRCDKNRNGGIGI